MVRQTGGNATQPSTAVRRRLRDVGQRTTASATTGRALRRPSARLRPARLPAGAARSTRTATGRSRTRRRGPTTCDSISPSSSPDFDSLLGPMHTNDEYPDVRRLHGGAQQRRPRSSRAARGGRATAAASTQPNMQGTLVQNAPRVDLPPHGRVARDRRRRVHVQRQDDDPAAVDGADQDHERRHQRRRRRRIDPAAQRRHLRQERRRGVRAYQPLNPYAQSAGNWHAAASVSASCGDAWVSGTYTTDLTIAAGQRLIVNGDVITRPNSDARLGLIADNFVRVYHPVVRDAHVGLADCSEPSTPDRRPPHRRRDPVARCTPSWSTTTTAATTSGR